jgi:hypothetical protein
MDFLREFLSLSAIIILHKEMAKIALIAQSNGSNAEFVGNSRNDFPRTSLGIHWLVGR